jgi:hypothetical protein
MKGDKVINYLIVAYSVGNLNNHTEIISIFTQFKLFQCLKIWKCTRVRGESETKYTILFCCNLKKYCAPFIPIWLCRRLSSTSVFWIIGQNRKKFLVSNLTVLFNKAVARCSAPMSPIWFPAKFNMSRVYIIKMP